MKLINQQIAIAELLKWDYLETIDGVPYGLPPTGDRSNPQPLPDCDDLNVIREVEKVLTEEQWENYSDFLEEILNPVRGWIHASATKKRKAILQSLKIWGSE